MICSRGLRSFSWWGHFVQDANASNEIWMDFFRNILPELFGLIRLFAS